MLEAMANKNLRLKLEIAGGSLIGVLGLWIGATQINPSGAYKLPLAALGGAVASGLLVAGYYAVNDRTGTLEREITSLRLKAESLQGKIDAESAQSAEILKIIEEREKLIAILESDKLHITEQGKIAVEIGLRWKEEAESRQILLRDANRKLEKLQNDFESSLKADAHRLSKAKGVQIASKLYSNYERAREVDKADLTAQYNLERDLAQSAFNDELGKLQARITELNAELVDIQAELEEVKAERDRLTEALTSLHKEDLPDIKRTFEAEWLNNDHLMQNAIEQLQRKNAELEAPKRFPGLTAIDKAGNRIIDHFAEYKVCLDAVESVSIPQGFRLRFKFDRTDSYLKLTEEEFDKRVAEPGLMGLSYAPLDFAMDARNMIVSVDIITVPPVAAIASGKPATASEAVEAIASGSSTSQNAFSALECFPASEFEQVIKDKFVPRVRVVAGSTGGKSPLMELIAVALAKLNQAELWLLNPLPGSPKDWFSVPGLIAPGSDGIQSEIAWLEIAHKELGKRRENLGAKQKFIMIMADEVNALARDYENLGTVLKDFYQLSDHAAMGIITAGQGANVSGVSGGASKKATGNAGKLMEEDFQNATQVFTSQAAKVWLKKHHADLLPKLAELEKLCTELNTAEGLSARPKPGTKIVDRNAYRVALVVSPASDEPFFIQIPAYSHYADKLDGVSFPKGATLTAPLENQVRLGLAASPEQCPECGSMNTKVNKTLKASIKRVCGDCGHYYNVPKSAAEKV
jgi:predicted  nucleic acid-binding Zn-ribbon protein